MLTVNSAIYTPNDDEQCRVQPVVSIAMDVLVGTFYEVFALFGIALHLVEVVACYRISRNNPGFYFICHHSAADILLLFTFGIWGGLVILSGCEITTPDQRIVVNILVNIPWWAMCYQSILVTFTRLLSISSPMTFRRITPISAHVSCLLVWLVAILQSYVVTLFPWYVPMYYDSNGYAFTCDWTAYANGGTRTYFYVFNGITVFSSLFFYIIILVKLIKMSALRNAIKVPSSTSGRIFTMAPSSAPAGAVKRPVLNRESFRRSAEFGLLLSCFITWVGFVFEQLFINWLFFEGPIRDILTSVSFMSQCSLNTILRISLSTVLRKEVRRLVRSLIPLEQLKVKLALKHSVFIVRS